MNDKILKNQRAWRRLLLLSALPVLLFSSCNEDQELSPQEITLTRPVIKLGGMEASASRAAGAVNWEDVASQGNLSLSMHDEERKDVGSVSFYYSNSSGWSAYGKGVTLTSGPGTYRAGIYANVYLNAADAAGMPKIDNAWYGYRGTIEVKADGSFTPVDALQPYSTAVQWVLKDANGADIATLDRSFYLIRPVGLAKMKDYTYGADGYAFPNGTADAVPLADNYDAFIYNSTADGDYTPGTYPATWTENKLQTAATLTAPWLLAEVVYCPDGFEYDNSQGDVPKGPSTTWMVSYPAKQLTLEAGKLYTFTIGLSKDAHITLGADDISIAPWGKGTPIHVGR